MNFQFLNVNRNEPVWKQVELEVKAEIESLKDQLVRARDPVQINRFQGAILILERLIADENSVSDAL